MPFMKRTTGDDVTAFCNWVRALLERKRVNVEDWNDDERRAERNMTGDFAVDDAEQFTEASCRFI